MHFTLPMIFSMLSSPWLLFGSLGLTQIAAWLGPRSFWVWGGLGLSLSLGAASGRFFGQEPAIYVLLLTAVLFWLFYRQKIFFRGAVGILAFVSGFALMKHWLPGIQNWCYAAEVHLSPASAEWNFWINFDKAFISIFLLIFATRTFLQQKEWALIKRHVPFNFLGCAAILLSISCVAGFIKWSPKVPEILPMWALTNLFFVVVPEEVFFRLFLQKSLEGVFQKYGLSWMWGWGITSFLFALFHFPAPPLYLVLSGIAGLFYGYALHQTSRVESSIFVHFFLNLLHFLCFTYPFSQ